MRLSTLIWPPYTTVDGQGTAERVVRAVFAAQGYQVSLAHVPWQRAMLSVRHGDGPDSSDGVFPTYTNPDRDAICQWSQAIGHSPIGLAERRDSPVVWKDLRDLSGVSLGVIQGFVNGEAFDHLVKDGSLTVEAVADDATNLRKLLAHRLQAAVIDKNVMTYLLSSDPALRGSGEELQFNARLVEDLPFRVCFRKDERGLMLARLFDDGLRKISNHIDAP